MFDREKRFANLQQGKDTLRVRFYSLWPSDTSATVIHLKISERNAIRYFSFLSKFQALKTCPNTHILPLRLLTLFSRPLWQPFLPLRCEEPDILQGSHRYRHPCPETYFHNTSAVELTKNQCVKVSTYQNSRDMLLQGFGNFWYANPSLTKEGSKFAQRTLWFYTNDSIAPLLTSDGGWVTTEASNQTRHPSPRARKGDRQDCREGGKWNKEKFGKYPVILHLISNNHNMVHMHMSICGAEWQWWNFHRD